jgi:hypothetical protein
MFDQASLVLAGIQSTGKLLNVAKENVPIIQACGFEPNFGPTLPWQCHTLFTNPPF